MTLQDDFTNRVANLSADTVRMLEHVMRLLENEGFVGEIDMCATFIEKHKKLAYDCAVITQNIEIPKRE